MPADPGLTLTPYSAEPGTTASYALRLLASPGRPIAAHDGRRPALTREYSCAVLRDGRRRWVTFRDPT